LVQPPLWKSKIAALGAGAARFGSKTNKSRGPVERSAYVAELAARDYSTDADWTNAFGLRRKGKAEIFEFLSKIYRSPTMRPRKSTLSKTTLRFLNGDAAVASSYRETVGQKTHSGSDTRRERRTTFACSCAAETAGSSSAT
jgi:hypothetical protein